MTLPESDPISEQEAALGITYKKVYEDDLSVYGPLMTAFCQCSAYKVVWWGSHKVGRCKRCGTAIVISELS